MDYLQAAFLGLIEGVTEYLPISSTGHLILAERLLGITDTDSGFFKSFTIVIQFGAILAVVAIYARTLLVNRQVVQRVLVAFVPTGVLGLTLYKEIKKLLDRPEVVVASLAVGGVFLILFELWHRENESAEEDLAKLPYSTCLLIGLAQAVSMIPGVSRSAATVVGGMALGLKRRTVVEFSFLLAVPTMAAASGYDLYKNAASFSLDQVQFLAVGFVVSFVVAWLSIEFLLRWVKRHTFILFGVYRILAAGMYWWWGGK